MSTNKRNPLIIGSANQPDEETAAIMGQLNKDIQDYHKAEKAGKHDPLKVVIAGMVNEKMLMDTAKESEEAAKKVPGGKAIPPKLLKQMQNWAFRYHKSHPFKTQEEVAQATAKKFNVNLVPDESDTGS